MRRAFIATGTLGGGTLIAFVLAALAFMADPVGRAVPAGGWAAPIVKGAPVPVPAVVVDPAVPMPMPAIADDLVLPAQGVGVPGIAPVAREEMVQAIREELERSAKSGG